MFFFRSLDGSPWSWRNKSKVAGESKVPTTIDLTLFEVVKPGRALRSQVEK